MAVVMHVAARTLVLFVRTDESPARTASNPPVGRSRWPGAAKLLLLSGPPAPARPPLREPVRNSNPAPTIVSNVRTQSEGQAAKSHKVLTRGGPRLQIR